MSIWPPEERVNEGGNSWDFGEREVREVVERDRGDRGERGEGVIKKRE